MLSTRRGMDGREVSSFRSGVATVSTHIVCLAKGGGGKEGCLASKALEAVAISGAVIAGAVRTWVELGWGIGLSGGCSSANVVGYTGRASSCGCPDDSDRMLSGKSGSRTR
jgi:hypothetical protein